MDAADKATDLRDYLKAQALEIHGSPLWLEAEVGRLKTEINWLQRDRALMDKEMGELQFELMQARAKLRDLGR